MASTNFLDDQTVIYAAWCNDVNNIVYNLLGSSGTPPANVAAIRTNLGLGTAALQNINSMTISGGTINGVPIGSTVPSSGSFTSLVVNGVISQTTTSSFNQQVPNVTRTISGGGAAVREIGDVASLSGPGSIEFGYSFNSNVNVTTGAWLNRDIANKNCWINKWEGSASKNQIWFSGNTGVIDPPTWTMKYEFDCINDLMTVNVRSKFSSIATNVTSVITSYSVIATDHTIIADAAGGAFTVTLPSAVLNPNRIIIVKRINTTNDVLVASTAGSIDGAVSRLLNTQWLSETYQSNGTNWYVI
jgi:hypothetical protein